MHTTNRLLTFHLCPGKWRLYLRYHSPCTSDWLPSFLRLPHQSSSFLYTLMLHFRVIWEIKDSDVQHQIQMYMYTYIHMFIKSCLCAKLQYSITCMSSVRCSQYTSIQSIKYYRSVAYEMSIIIYNLSYYVHIYL